MVQAPKQCTAHFFLRAHTRAHTQRPKSQPLRCRDVPKRNYSLAVVIASRMVFATMATRKNWAKAGCSTTSCTRQRTSNQQLPTLPRSQYHKEPSRLWGCFLEGCVSRCEWVCASDCRKRWQRSDSTSVYEYIEVARHELQCLHNQRAHLHRKCTARAGGALRHALLISSSFLGCVLMKSGPQQPPEHHYCAARFSLIRNHLLPPTWTLARAPSNRAGIEAQQAS
mgnify:CR=1 FL=1